MELGSKDRHCLQDHDFEATDKLGGKIVTRSFPGVGPYEAGVAETMITPDSGLTLFATSSRKISASRSNTFRAAPVFSTASCYIR